MNIKKCILPAQKRHNFLKLSQTQNGKLYISPTFQKVELRNSTFFQQKKSEIQVEVSELWLQKKSESRKDGLVRETINTIVGRLGLRMS